MSGDQEDRKPTNTVSRLMKQREDEKKLRGIAAEYEEEYKAALNGVASTPNGQIFLKHLLVTLGVFDPDYSGDPTVLLRNSEKRNIYFKLIRPYLEPELKQEIER